ncbi:MAG: Cytochrome oxidase assembly [Candidatus Rokubacteria bacterium CSP1-6]|nr:MAG: Cytochrome oxidase assembly [Candidatus Rokubacteria bacterium CSP1-6]
MGERAVGILLSPAWVHRLAVGLCAATFLLILFGGLVTNTGAALAVPDWPTTFGHNMFLFPWSQMVGGVFYEHTHRLLGAVVGLLTLVLAAAFWCGERRRWVRWLGVAAVFAVAVQGVLGGLRVVLVKDGIAIVHGALAQAFFGLAVALALVTSPSWATAAPAQAADALLLRRLALLTTGVVYLQIVLGAFLTHFGARLDGHLAGAAALALLIPALALRVQRGQGDQPALVLPARLLVALLVVQLLLGLGAYAGRFTGLALPLAPHSVLAFPVAHRLTGGLLLAASLLLTLRCHRLLAPPERGVAARELVSREVMA